MIRFVLIMMLTSLAWSQTTPAWKGVLGVLEAKKIGSDKGPSIEKDSTELPLIEQDSSKNKTLDKAEVEQIEQVKTTPALKTNNTVGNSNTFTVEKIEKERTKNLVDFNNKKNWLENQLVENTTKWKSEREIKSLPYPVVQPKGEFEKLGDYEKRQANWQEGLDSIHLKVDAVFSPKEKRLKQALLNLKESAGDFVGALEFETNPSKVEIWIDDKLYGVSPMQIVGLSPGYKNVALKKQGYIESRFPVEVLVKKSTEVEIELSKGLAFSSAGVVALDSLERSSVESEKEWAKRLNTLKNYRLSLEGEHKLEQEKLTANVAPLSAKGEFERSEDFSNRKLAWKKKNSDLTKVVDLEFESIDKAMRKTKRVLEDKRLVFKTQESTLSLLPAPIQLGSYNADAGEYPFVLNVVENKHSFEYKGVMQVDIPVAKLIKSNQSGLEARVKHLNWTHTINSGEEYYIQYNELFLSQSGKEIELEGRFYLSSFLAKDTSVIHLMNKDFGSSKSKGSFVKSPWLRYGLLGVATVLGAFSVQQHSASVTAGENFNPISQQAAITEENRIRKIEKNRDLLGLGAFGFLGLFALTWAF